MADLEKWQYRDPLEVAIRNEEKSCKGCKTIEVVELFGEVVIICDAGRPKTERCKKYKAE